MAQWPIPPDLHSEIEGGPFCPFHEHSLGSRDGRIPRYTDSHACVRCISALTEGRLSLDVHKIHRTFRRRFLEFWSFVEIGDPDECWNWHGNTHSKIQQHILCDASLLGQRQTVLGAARRLLVHLGRCRQTPH